MRAPFHGKGCVNAANLCLQLRPNSDLIRLDNIERPMLKYRQIVIVTRSNSSLMISGIEK